MAAPDSLRLPKLNGLSPTLASTVLKLMEEAGELARAVLHFLPYAELAPAQLDGAGTALLRPVAAELLDVAQTCVSMIFVMEERYGVGADALIDAHLTKLAAKGYRFDHSQDYRIAGEGDYKYLRLPRLYITGVTLLTTVCKIQEEVGELTQFLGKKQGASGETDRLAAAAAYRGGALELLDVAQCCFTMMYLLVERYQVPLAELVADHIAKLRQKGYCH